MDPAAATDARLDDTRGRRRRWRRGALLAGGPLAVLVLPLFAHRSVDPAIGPYGTLYLGFVIGAAVVAVAVALAVGWACARARGSGPAHAFVLGLVALGGACLIAEMLLTYHLRLEDAFAQYRAWGHKRSLLFAFEATPDHSWVNAGATYTTDRFGFRTHLRDGPWDTRAATRIFALGESSVFGYGLNDDETWPHLLEGLLRTRRGDPSLTVVNAGNNGHTSLQTLFRFYTKILPLRPTHALLYLGPNDVYGTGPDRLLISEEILFSGSVAQFWAAATRGQNPYARSLLFYVAQQYIPALGGVRRPDQTAGAPAMTHGESLAQWQAREMEIIGRNFVENVRTLCEIGRAHGIEPVLATFMEAMEGWAPHVLRHNNALLRRLAAAEGITLIDVAAAFESAVDKESHFFADRYHPNHKGAAFIASTIAQHWP